MNFSDETSVKKYFDQQTVLITGGYTIINKVLTEKLLTYCCDVKHVYILLNDEEFYSNKRKYQVFNIVKKEHLFKLVFIRGSLKESGLGLSISDEKRIKNNVSVVFYSNEKFECGKILELEFTNFIRTLKNLEILVCLTSPNINNNCLFSPHGFRDKTAGLPRVWSQHEEIELLRESTSGEIDYSQKPYKTIIIKLSTLATCEDHIHPGDPYSLDNLIRSLATSNKLKFKSSSSDKINMVPVDDLVNFMIPAVWYGAVKSDKVTQIYNATNIVNNPPTLKDLQSAFSENNQILTSVHSLWDLPKLSLKLPKLFCLAASLTEKLFIKSKEDEFTVPETNQLMYTEDPCHEDDVDLIRQQMTLEEQNIFKFRRQVNWRKVFLDLLQQQEDKSLQKYKTVMFSVLIRTLKNLGRALAVYLIWKKMSPLGQVMCINILLTYYIVKLSLKSI